MRNLGSLAFQNMLFTCNHHEADTVIVSHAARSTKPVVVTARYTDVLALVSECLLISKQIFLKCFLPNFTRVS